MCRHLRLGSLPQDWLFVLGFLLVAASGCQLGMDSGVPPGTHVVEMSVLKGREGETLALVPVLIEGKGPFIFALDTGAVRTIVDRRIAEELGLPVVGDDVTISG